MTEIKQKNSEKYSRVDIALVSFCRTIAILSVPTACIWLTNLDLSPYPGPTNPADDFGIGLLFGALFSSFFVAYVLKIRSSLRATLLTIGITSGVLVILFNTSIYL
jgi:hypothetical protein